MFYVREQQFCLWGHLGALLHGYLFGWKHKNLLSVGLLHILFQKQLGCVGATELHVAVRAGRRGLHRLRLGHGREPRLRPHRLGSVVSIRRRFELLHDVA